VEWFCVFESKYERVETGVLSISFIESEAEVECELPTLSSARVAEEPNEGTLSLKVVHTPLIFVSEV